MFSEFGHKGWFVDWGVACPQMNVQQGKHMRFYKTTQVRMLIKATNKAV